MTGDLRLELFCEDVGRALAFYTDILGFSALPSDDPTYRPLERDGIRLALQSIEVLPDDHPLLDGGRRVPRGNGVELVLEVDDLEDLYERVQARIHLHEPLQARAWGLRDFRVVDPEGYYLRFTHRLALPARTAADDVDGHT